MGKLSSVDIIGNGRANYYSTDDMDNLSLNRATCSQIQMLFSQGKVTRITLLGLPDGKFNPVDDVGNENLQVRRIKPQL